MEIVAIEAIALSHSLEEGQGFGSARGTTDARFTTLVRLVHRRVSLRSGGVHEVCGRGD